MPYDAAPPPDKLLSDFKASRAVSEALAAPLSDEDMMLQSMTEASPVKWNLAHTSWFYETFLLGPHLNSYEAFHPAFAELFNSYYQQVGAMHPRGERALLSRPSADEVRAYRGHVTEAMGRLIEGASEAEFAEISPLVQLGIAHEQQHQELLLTDLKHCLYQNPLAPAPYEDVAACEGAAPELTWARFDGGLADIGAPDDEGFYFDNEGPRHKAYVGAFELASRPVTNAEYMAFMEAGGYENSAYWLSDGWDVVCEEGWTAPLYWRCKDGAWVEYTLFGLRPVNPDAPVCHISYYEAAAYAEWTGYRLPTEQEWEVAADGAPLRGRFLEAGAPAAPQPADGEGVAQLYGDVWEWTRSPYAPYPGYRAAKGAVGEYNGKFMSSQMVLRGGSCATPAGHMRASYRNFFPPNARWQFAGLRLARDVE